MMRDKAIEMGLIPPASGYLEDGTPAYRLEDVATRLGLSESEAQASLAQFMAERAAAGLDTMLINPALVHRTQ
jgi:hypothetical protein